MTLNGVMAVILRYFSEFSYLPGVLGKSSRSLSHLLMSSCTNTVMNTLNSLPNCVVFANTTKTLKTRFDKLGTIRIHDIYNFRA